MKYYTQFASLVGKLLLVADDAALTGIYFEGARDYPVDTDDGQERPDHSILKAARQQLEEYFAGRRETFDLPLAPAGTPFQRSVWKALERIAYGETQSYGQIAQSIGSPKAVRAVGAANGANPIPIVIPCHRVIGGDGSLTGYGGGLARKRQLLALEQDNASFDLSG
ncbi:MAG: methylated-DNA--[protein]-cysteine S-methyltransferase [Bryobacteraceae bacterium]